MQEFIKAEDSFIKIFGNKETEDLGEIYSWAEGGIWPKYNFVRPSFSLNLENNVLKLPSVEQQWLTKKLKYLSSLKKKPSIRVDRNMNVPKGYEQDGTPIVHLKYWPKKSHDETFGLGEFQLKVCERSDLMSWWNIHSEFTPPKKIQLIFDKFKSHFEAYPGQYYLLRYKDEFTHSISVIESEGLLNRWGANTVESYRNMGHYIMATNLLFSRFGKLAFNGQFNEDSKSLALLKKYFNTEVLATEKRIVLIDA